MTSTSGPGPVDVSPWRKPLTLTLAGLLGGFSGTAAMAQKQVVEPCLWAREEDPHQEHQQKKDPKAFRFSPICLPEALAESPAPPAVSDAGPEPAATSSSPPSLLSDRTDALNLLKSIIELQKERAALFPVNPFRELSEATARLRDGLYRDTA